VPAVRWTAIDKTVHVVVEAGHIERTVLHTYVDVVGPRVSVLESLFVCQYVTCMTAVVVDRLVLLKEFDCAVDAVCHGGPARW